jgi:hypothetical protein
MVFWAGQYAVVGAVFDPAAAGRAPAILDVFAGLLYNFSQQQIIREAVSPFL